MKWGKFFLFIILFFFLALFLHNAWYYPPTAGYDDQIHFLYTKIITFEKRIPVPADTPESYNPPLFYFLSGKIAQIFLPCFNGELLPALKTWQILIAILLPIAGYLWFDLFRKLNPKNSSFGYLFLFWFLSLPVVNKMAPMYNIETLQLIESSFVIWFFIKYFLKKPKLSLTIWLGVFGGILLLTRIMSALLLIALGITIILLWWWRKISFKKMLFLGLIFTSVTLLIGGWYYYFFKDWGVFDSGENPKDFQGIPLLKRQPKSFYLDTFFRTSMRTPIRPNFPNRFIPIFYSTFWGDYWNYYCQRRFKVSSQKAKKFPSNKTVISKERLKVLAWQNRINLIPTIILIISFFLSLKETFSKLVKRPKKINFCQTAESFLTIFFTIAFIGFFYTNLKFPNLYKGDTIKASFVLFAIPVLIYFATKNLIKLKKRKIIFLFSLLAVLISFLFNLHFDFY